MKNLRVLVICRPDQLPPDSLDGLSEKEIYACKTEWDVFTTLRASGHPILQQVQVGQRLFHPGLLGIRHEAHGAP